MNILDQSVCQIYKMRSEQLPPRFSSSSKKSRTSRQLLMGNDKCEKQEVQNNYLLASKFGDLSQRNQTNYSRELDTKKIKNQNENIQYIRNLYKKYLGKENNPSQRKNKTDAKDTHLQKNVPVDQKCRRQKLVYDNPRTAIDNKSAIKPNQPQQKIKRQSSDKQRYSQRKVTLCKKFSEQISASQPNKTLFKSVKPKQETNHTELYEMSKNIDLLKLMGGTNNSWVLAMKTINSIKNKYK